MKKTSKILRTIFISPIAIIFILPVLLTMTNSFMKQAEIEDHYSYSSEAREGMFFRLVLIPEKVSLNQYYSILIEKPQYLYMFWNSCLITFPIILGQVSIGAMAAYAFSKLKFRHRDGLFYIYIIVMLMPFQATLVPNYIVIDWLGLLGKRIAIILPGIFTTFGVFLLRQFMQTIPNEYIEASKAEGCNHSHIFFRIMLPLSKTGIIALTILLFIDNWNLVEQPLIFLRDHLKYPLSIYLAVINQGELAVAFAAATLYMIPVLLIFRYGESHMLAGIQFTGIKA